MSGAEITLSLCPTYAPALGFAGATFALVMACVGSAYGTGKAAMGISTIGVDQPDVRGPAMAWPRAGRFRRPGCGLDCRRRAVALLAQLFVPALRRAVPGAAAAVS